MATRPGSDEPAREARRGGRKCQFLTGASGLVVFCRERASGEDAKSKLERGSGEPEPEAEKKGATRDGIRRTTTASNSQIPTTDQNDGRGGGQTGTARLRRPKTREFGWAADIGQPSQRPGEPSRRQAREKSLGWARPQRTLPGPGPGHRRPRWPRWSIVVVEEGTRAEEMLDNFWIWHFNMVRPVDEHKADAEDDYSRRLELTGSWLFESSPSPESRPRGRTPRRWTMRSKRADLWPASSSTSTSKSQSMEQGQSTPGSASTPSL